MSDRRPRAILFDAGGTVVLQHPERMAERLGIGVDPDVAFDAHYRTMAEFSRLKLGGDGATWDWWLERYFLLLGHPEPAAAGVTLDRGWGLWTWPIAGAVEALEEIRSSGIRIAVISNSDGSVRSSLDEAGFGGLFEFVIDSHEVGVKKPDPAIFTHALDRLDLQPSEVWYVGDSEYHDVGGARSAGLAAGWLVDPLDLHQAVEQRVASVAELPEVL